MAFYVPLGFRGLAFNIGTFLITVFGGLVYWRASRKRHRSAIPPISLSFDFLDADLLPLAE